MAVGGGGPVVAVRLAVQPEAQDRPLLRLGGQDPEDGGPADPGVPGPQAFIELPGGGVAGELPQSGLNQLLLLGVSFIRHRAPQP